MGKKILLLIVLSITSFFSFANPPKKANFIKVKDTHFEISGKPYYFVGMNLWFGAYLGSPTLKGGRERLKKELDLLKSKGVTNLRILGASEKANFAHSIQLAIQEKPGVYNQDLLKGLDFVLAEMHKRGMFAVIYLNNFWEWSGGMSQYVAWATNKDVIDPSTTNDWTGFMNNSKSFYTNDSAQKIFRNYVSMLVNRKNTISKTLYRNDPTIMAWQLSNEPRPGPDREGNEVNHPAYIKWIDESAGYIHSLDKNHLVSTGSEGLAGSNYNEALYLKAHSSKNIDYATFHLWAKNWGWFKCDQFEQTYQVSENKALEYIKSHIELAKKLNKPITMEEFGLDRDNCSLVPGSPCTARDRYFAKVYSLVEENMKSGAPLAGTNVWAWGGFGVPSKDAKDINAGMYVGDPFAEPQGLNTVFAADESTLLLIDQHAKRLKNK